MIFTKLLSFLMDEERLQHCCKKIQLHNEEIIKKYFFNKMGDNGNVDICYVEKKVKELQDNVKKLENDIKKMEKIIMEKLEYDIKKMKKIIHELYSEVFDMIGGNENIDEYWD